MLLQIIVINLDSRPDRWAEVSNELERIRLTPFSRFTAITGISGENGCALSHYAILKQDVTRPVLILEDDVIFDDGWDKVFGNALTEIPGDYDMLYLGANVKQPAERYSEHLFRINGGVHCTHAILYSAQGRKKMIDNWNPNNNECKQIDHWLYMTGQSLLNCYVVYPMIAWQRPSYSDVRKQWFDYRGEMEENAKNNMK